MLKWLQNQGAELTSSIIDMAAHNNHIHILSWARKNKCEWPRHVATNTWLRCNLYTYFWLRIRGCPVD